MSGVNQEFSHQALELLADGCGDRYAVFTPYGGRPAYGGRITLSNGVSVSVSYRLGQSWGELAAWIDDGPTVVLGDVYDFSEVAAVVGAVLDGDADLSRLAA
jgi:hypothetical protein